MASSGKPSLKTKKGGCMTRFALLVVLLYFAHTFHPWNNCCSQSRSLVSSPISSLPTLHSSQVWVNPFKIVIWLCEPVVKGRNVQVFRHNLIDSFFQFALFEALSQVSMFPGYHDCAIIRFQILILWLNIKQCAFDYFQHWVCCLQWPLCIRLVPRFSIQVFLSQYCQKILFFWFWI